MKREYKPIYSYAQGRRSGNIAAGSEARSLACLLAGVQRYSKASRTLAAGIFQR